MTKAEMVAEISNVTGVEKEKALKVIEAMMVVVKEKTADGETSSSVVSALSPPRPVRQRLAVSSRKTSRLLCLSTRFLTSSLARTTRTSWQSNKRHGRRRRVAPDGATLLLHSCIAHHMRVFSPTQMMRISKSDQSV